MSKYSDPSYGESIYRGWKSLQLTNGLIKLDVVPSIGGRVIQFAFGGAEFLWVNPQLAGQPPPASRLNPDGGWLNYGGDKIWPAPQGWDNDQQWPGPPDAVLDGGAYTLDDFSGDAGEATAQLTSEKDSRSGVQFTRRIRIFKDSTQVAMEVTMKNIDIKPRRWGIWGVTQLDAAKPGGAGHNDLFRVYCPLNPQSYFPKGYDILFGAKDNPTFRTDVSCKMMELHYQYKVGKIVLDSSAGWLAVVNGITGNVFVERFTFVPGQEYPDGASVEFWSHGLGRFHAFGRDMELKDDPAETPFFVESEVLSPFARLEPNESYTYRYDWCATNIGGDHPILDCQQAGVTVERLSVKAIGSDWKLTGRFGVFVKGTLLVEWLGSDGAVLARKNLPREVTPLQPVILDETIMASPRDARSVALLVIDLTGQKAGVLASTFLEQA